MYTSKFTRVVIPVLLAFIFSANVISAGNIDKQRMIVLTDIEAEADDTQSMVRLLLYSNEIDIKGLIATTSVHQKDRTAVASLVNLMWGYDKVRDNLILHDSGYPESKDLFKVIKEGQPVYGMEGVGEGKDSDGSDWIIKVLEEEDDRPLWVSVWGGANTLAQALYKIRETKSEEEAAKLIARLRVYTISDQDDSGIWIRNNFPELFYIVSPGGYNASIWIAIMQEAPAGFNNEVISNEWLAENIQQGHGRLGQMYPDAAYGMEGDTPSWLNLVPNGLSMPEHPEWGGWGGRYEFYKPGYEDVEPDGFTGGVPVEEETRAIWTNAVDEVIPSVPNKYGRAVMWDTANTSKGYKETLWRWREDFQNDFAARMDWCTKSYADANHPPNAFVLNREIIVKSGEWFHLEAESMDNPDVPGTVDPDGDSVSYLWFHYPEAGTYKERINVDGAENLRRVKIKAPVVDKMETAHFILRVTDKGTPPLSRYARVIVTIVP